MVERVGKSEGETGEEGEGTGEEEREGG